MNGLFAPMLSVTRGRARVVRHTTGIALLAGCVVGTPAYAASHDSAPACGNLARTVVGPENIGLPSGRAIVIEAVADTERSPTGVITPFCRVSGEIAPIDPAAQPIRFRLNLPDRWNHKLILLGGGGFNGVVADGTGPLRDFSPTDATPLARGFATAASDSGHRAGGRDEAEVARFTLNDEMLRNFAFAAYKKLRDVASALAVRHYRHAVERRYYFGGSEGGREGLTMAQRFPDDFDGIVSVVPVISWTGLFYSFAQITRPQIDGGALDAGKVKLLSDAVMAACDARDGIADGIVSDYLGCRAAFTPDRLRCADGTTGEGCLSDAQLATLRAVYGPVVLPTPVANGVRVYPGRLFGGEIGPNQDGLARWHSTGRPPANTISASDARGVQYGRNAIAFLIARDPGYDTLHFDPAPFLRRMREVSTLLDSTNPDLSRFAAHGGKIIIRENAGDMAQSPMAGVDYVEAVRARLGAKATDRFLRLYMSPASGHSGGAVSVKTGDIVPTDHDLLTDLDRWVVEGVVPADSLLQTSSTKEAPFAIRSSRPMCRYPAYPRYNGGDAKLALSYSCYRQVRDVEAALSPVKYRQGIEFRPR